MNSVKKKNRNGIVLLFFLILVKSTKKSCPHNQLQMKKLLQIFQCVMETDQMELFTRKLYSVS
jgi:hypothetical protein